MRRVLAAAVLSLAFPIAPALAQEEPPVNDAGAEAPVEASPEAPVADAPAPSLAPSEPLDPAAEQPPADPSAPPAPGAPTSPVSPPVEPPSAAAPTPAVAPAAVAPAAAPPEPSAPPTPAAQEAPATPPATAAAPRRTEHPAAQHMRIIAAYRVGFAGGSADYDFEDPLLGASTTHDTLVSTDAIALRIEDTIGPYFALGGMFQGSVFNTEEAERTQESPASVFDLGIVPRGRYTFDFGTIGVEPSLAVPVGLTVALFDKDFTPDPALGWHIGVLAGAQVFFGRTFGMLAELGYLRHRVSVDHDRFTADVTLSQWTFEIGILLVAGGSGTPAAGPPPVE